MGRAHGETDPRGATGSPVVAGIVIAAVVVGLSVYANGSFDVTTGADYRFFPPFRPHHDANMNGHLGAEYFSIARSLAAGRGFADPFREPTGPTAWMPPVLPAVEAALLRAAGGDRDTVMAVVVFLQVCVLVATGLLAVAVAGRTTAGGRTALVALVFLTAVVVDFHTWFQFTHDCWLVLLALDLLVAGLVWSRPFGGRTSAALWGLLGGFCALVGPVVGFVWAAVSLATGWHRPDRARLAAAALVAVLVVSPWAVRNYVVFGRLIPVKSNAAYELYQSQCLLADGLIRKTTFDTHPYMHTGREWEEYKALGETAFLDRKWVQFRAAVAADPIGFLDRVAERLLAATVWYVPFDRAEPADRPWAFAIARLVHPLPFLAALLLVVTARRAPLHAVQRAVIGVYVLYLLPYVVVSYYDRYAAPLLGVKVLLVVWAVDRLRSGVFRKPVP